MRRLQVPDWPALGLVLLAVVVAILAGMSLEGNLRAQELVSPKGFVELPLASGPRTLVPLSQIHLVEEAEEARTAVDLVGGRRLSVALGYEEVKRRVGGGR